MTAPRIITLDSPGLMTWHGVEERLPAAMTLTRSRKAAASSPTRPATLVAINTTRNTCIKSTNTSRRNHRSRSRSLPKHSLAHDTLQGSSQKRIQTGNINAITRRNSERGCADVESPPPSEWFASPKVQRLPPRRPPPGAQSQYFLSFFLSLIWKTQANHWTKRMLNT